MNHIESLRGSKTHQSQRQSGKVHISPRANAPALRGFTIVELLIVIVIIAILAAITIVAFNGIQQRARNNARMSGASAIARALEAFVIQTGQNVPGPPVCIPIGGKDYSGDGIPDCNLVMGAVPNRWPEKAATTSALASAGFSGFSYPTDEVTGTNGEKYAGIALTFGGSATEGMNGVLQPFFLYFRLEGEGQDCGSRLSVRRVSNPDPLYRIVPAQYYGSGNGVTTCAYAIKHNSSI